MTQEASRPVECRHWLPSTLRGRGKCAIGAYLDPPYAVCMQVCNHYQGSPRAGAETLDQRTDQQRRGLSTGPCGKPRPIPYNAEQPDRVRSSLREA